MSTILETLRIYCDALESLDGHLADLRYRYGGYPDYPDGYFHETVEDLVAFQEKVGSQSWPVIEWKSVQYPSQPVILGNSTGRCGRAEDNPGLVYDDPVLASALLSFGVEVDYKYYDSATRAILEVTDEVLRNIRAYSVDGVNQLLKLAHEAFHEEQPPGPIRPEQKFQFDPVLLDLLPPLIVGKHSYLRACLTFELANLADHKTQPGGDTERRKKKLSQSVPTRVLSFDRYLRQQEKKTGKANKTQCLRDFCDGDEKKMEALRKLHYRWLIKPNGDNGTTMNPPD